MSPAIAAHAEENRLRESICEIGRSLFERGLTAGSSGNISVRLNGRLAADPDQRLARPARPGAPVQARRGRPAPGGDAPSKEAFLHRAMYEERPQAAPSCICIRPIRPPYPAWTASTPRLHPALTAYYVMKIGRLPLIPYYRPGDPKLGDAIRGRACRHCAVLLANHGPVVSGATLDAAVNAIEELEETAKLFLLLRDAPTRPLDERQIDELNAVFGPAG